MTQPYVSSILRNKAARLGLAVEAKPFRRVRGWPVKSEKPFQVSQAADGKHVASFADAFAVLNFLKRRECAK